MYPGEGEGSAFGEEVPPPLTRNRFPNIKKGRDAVSATKLRNSFLVKIVMTTTVSEELVPRLGVFFGGVFSSGWGSRALSG